jgi:hypothetical protein
MINRGTLKPHGVRLSYLNINSTMDPLWELSSHNPADFVIQVPNSLRTSKIWRIVNNTCVIPRMFPNIAAPDNGLAWYQREVVEIPTAAPNVWLRTVSPVWTLRMSLFFEPGIWNVDLILAKLNSVTGPNEVWAFDAVNGCFVVTETPTAPPVVFGTFFDPVHVPPPVTYANMTYLAEAGGHVFDVLGLEKQASIATNLPLSPALVPTSPDTFDNLTGSNLDSKNVLPLFDRSAHDYTTWATVPFISPLNNKPNLSGPVVVHVVLADLGDSSAVEAKNGMLQDIVTSVNLADVEFGAFKAKEVNDVEGEGIEYVAPRNISQFRVKLLDTQSRQLYLPRNYPVHLKVQLLCSSE